MQETEMLNEFQSGFSEILNFGVLSAVLFVGEVVKSKVLS